MEPIKQLIQMSAPNHFRPSHQAGDSQESFVAYFGQAQTPRRPGALGSSTDESQLQLSPLAQMVSSLPAESRNALVSLMEIVPDNQRQQLGQILTPLANNENSEAVKGTLNNLLELFNRISSENGEQADLNISLTLRDLSGLSTGSQKYFFDSLDNFLNLSSRDLTGLMTNQDGLSDQEYQDFLTVLSNLLKRGVVGTEEVRVNDQKRTTFVTTRMGDSKLRQAEDYRRGRFPLDRYES